MSLDNLWKSRHIIGGTVVNFLSGDSKDRSLMSFDVKSFKFQLVKLSNGHRYSPELDAAEMASYLNDNKFICLGHISSILIPQ